MKYYKTVRPDGLSFLDTRFRWVPAEGNPAGSVVEYRDDPTAPRGIYPYVSTAPTNCIGTSWPCRLLELKPIGTPYKPVGELPYGDLYDAQAWKVVRELPSYLTLGPQYKEVLGMMKAATRMTALQAKKICDNWNRQQAHYDSDMEVRAGVAVGDGALESKRYGAWCAARFGMWKAVDLSPAAQQAPEEAVLAADIAGSAAGAIILRDVLERLNALDDSAFSYLTSPWAEAMSSSLPQFIDASKPMANEVLSNLIRLDEGRGPVSVLG